VSEVTVQKFHHRRFGDLEIPSASVLHCDGLPGFPALKQLAVIEHDAPSPFAWLVSLDDPDLAFVVADPRRFFADYAPAFSPHQLLSIGLEAGHECELLAIATLDRKAATLNLAAPIIVNPRTHRAAQAILEGAEHPLRADLSRAPVEAAHTDPTPPDQIESKPQR
jgi:flagellar assembly factor FliW